MSQQQGPPGGVNVGFTHSSVNFEQATQVDQDGSISMEEFDGREAPVHARKVSVRKPEIIGLFEYHPVFKEIMQGDDQEKQKVLTDAGRYIDTQITARKIRLDDIRVLFEQLSKDPESPTGQIVENLIGVLESKITDVKNDFEAIKTVSDTVLQFLDTLDLSRPSISQENVFKALREKRFEDNPLRLPRSDNRALDFNKMMVENFGETLDDGEQEQGRPRLEASGTKAFLNFLQDLTSVMKGSMIFPNPGVTIRIGSDQGPADQFNDARNVILPVVNVTNRYGRAQGYGGGLCSLQLDNGGENFYSFLGRTGPPNFNDETNPALNTGARFNDVFYRGRGAETSNAQDCALIAQTIIDDLSFSSAIGNDALVEFAAAFSQRNLTDHPQNFTDFLTGFDSFINGTIHGFDLVDQDTRVGLVAATLYDPDRGGEKSPIRTFDPGTLSVPDENGVTRKIQNTAYDQLLKPILETMQEGDSVNTTPLEAFIKAVPDTLTNSASVLDQYFATNDPVLNAKSLLIKILTSIRNRIPDLNIGEEVDFSDANASPMATGPMIDFCLLAESAQDVTMDNSFDMLRLNSDQDSSTYSRLKINDLLTTYLMCLAKSATPGKYASVIPIVSDAPMPSSFSSLGIRLSKHIRMSLLNTYTNGPIEPVNFSDGEGFVGNAIGVMQKEDTVVVTEASDLTFNEDSSGVSDLNFPGKKFSASRTRTNRATNWKMIYQKVDVEDIENSDINTQGCGSLHRPNSVDENRYGNLEGCGTFNAVRLDGSFAASPGKRIYGSQIQERLAGVVGINRKESIFSDIVDVVDEIYDAAVARGPIVDRQTGKMISSGADPSYIMSFVISLYAIIIRDLLRVRFSAASALYREEHGDQFAGEANLGNHNLPVKGIWRQQGRKTTTIMQLAGIVASREFISDLNNFLTPAGEVESLPAPGSNLGKFLSRFNNQVDGNTRARLDGIDMLRTLGDSLSSAANRYIEAFVNDNNQIRVDKQFERIKAVLPLAIDRTQVTAMTNQLQNVDSKEGFGRYFDDFMLSQAQENFFYGSLLGPGQGYQTYHIDPEVNATFPRPSVDDGNRVNFTKDKNIRMLTFGIPQGFSRTVLGVDPILEPDRFAERRVDVYVIAKDHLSGEALSIIPQPYTFDLGLFFDSVSDPVVSSPQTNSQLNEETSPEFLSNFNQSIANRKYPARTEIFQGNVKMRRILLEEGKTQVVSRPVGVGIEQAVFDNHVYDMLAKTYIKVTTGMSVTENDFFVDSSIENRLATEPDLRNLSNLMNTHISQLLGRDVTFNDYLSGDRKFRELLNRLSKGEKTAQIIDEIKVNLEGTTEDANTLSSEDLVAFSRMISSNNPVITPGLFRDKIVSPRLFERVFSIFINPDKFVALPFPGNPDRDSDMAGLRTRFMEEIFDNGNSSPAIGSGVDEDLVVPSRFGGTENNRTEINNAVIGFESNQSLPIVNMYQVLVVPHGTPIDFFAAEEE